MDTLDAVDFEESIGSLRYQKKSMASSSVPVTTSKVHLAEHGEEEILPEEQMVTHDYDKEIQLMSPVLVQQDPAKLLHLGHQLVFISAFFLCASIQLFRFWSKEVVVGFVSTPEKIMLLSVMVLDLLSVWLYPTRSRFAGLSTYLRTGVVVLEDYTLLITLNRKYIEIAILPFTIFGFICALASKGSKYKWEEVLRKDLRKSAKEHKKIATVPYLLQLHLVVWTRCKGIFTLWEGLTKSRKDLMKMAMVPYLVQLGLVVWTRWKGPVEEGNIFIFSSFLLFLDSALCALTVMIASAPIEFSDGANLVLPVMHKTCSVVLVMAAHSMATEWLRRDIVFACMPELTLGLTWFTIYCDHPEHVMSINSAKMHRSLVIVLSLVGGILSCRVLEHLYGEDKIILRSWFVWVSCISCSSSALSFLDAWLLDRWPAGSTPDTNGGGLAQVLKFYSLISFCISAVCMLCDCVVQYITIDVFLGTMAAILLVSYSKAIISLWYHPYRLPRPIRQSVMTEEDRTIAPPPVIPHSTGLYEKNNIDDYMKYLEETLLAYADPSPSTLLVLCIFGFDECMETIISTKVYECIKRKFSYHLKVEVGQNPDMAQLMKNMITELQGKYEDADEVNQLTMTLCQHLKNKRYLVVLEDLCSDEDWRTIESCFPQENPMSRIIITTGNEDVAKAAGDHFYLIPARLEANVAILFSRKISDSLSGKRTFHGIFANKPYAKEDSFKGSGLHWIELEQMKQFIKHRYNGLTADLRACLLYLSIFPEKNEVEMERLVRLWVADGFIRGQDGPLTEETARDHINELIDRKLIEVSIPDHEWTLRSCTVHPLIHEFIVWQARKNEYVCVIQEGLQDNPSSDSSYVWSHRFLCLARWISYQYKSTKEARDYPMYLPYVCSVTAFGQASGIPRLETPLRVLDLEGCEGPVNLDRLCEMDRLRYLSLRGTDVSELPEQIGALIYLQTLDVRSTKVKKLPPSIVRLEDLMHLLAGDAELPPGIIKMKALETLSCASAMKSSGTVSIKELGEIACLRELELFCTGTIRLWDIFLQSILGIKRRIIFLSNGFRSLEKLSIQCSFTSVIFKDGALPKVHVIEIKFDKGVQEESTAVSGIEHLLSLKYVLLEFWQPGRGNAATITAVRLTAENHRNNPQVSVLGYRGD